MSFAEQPHWWIALAVISVALIALVRALRPRYVAYRERIRRQKLLHSVSVEFLSNVALADGLGGCFHIDYLLLTAKGVVILDFWDVVGNVFGSDPMTDWTVTQPARRNTFANPQAALYDRLAALRAIVGAVPVEGRIVFADTAVFPKGMPRFTLLESQLSSEFFFGERHLAERAVEPWRPAWDQLKASLTPSVPPGKSL
jgi:hypothetical protein